MPNTFTNNPTSISVGFDWNSFSWGFAMMDAIPTVNKTIIEREFQRVEIGQAIALIINLQNIMTSPGQRFNFDVFTPPQVEIYNPDNTVKVPFADMNHIGQVGYYNYQHQTTLGGTFGGGFDPLSFDPLSFATTTFIIAADQTGIYTARFQAVNGTMTCFTDKMVVFEVTAR